MILEAGNEILPHPISLLIETFLLVVGALFPIVDPLGNTPIFLLLTRGSSTAMRTALARKIAMNGFFLLVGSLLIGTHILAFFGISLPVVQVGGGMIVISTGWALLNQKDDEPDDAAAQEAASESAISKQAFYPLTLPLTVGPGSISVAITVGANRPPGSETSWYLPIASILGAAVIAVTIYLSYRFAAQIARALGQTAMNVIIRLSSFILLCIGVQIVWNGASTLLRSVLVNR
jgi:multiple antibiotic resistance protein